MSLRPGSRFGAYEIHSALGAGAMGEVYRGRDTKLHRSVAIKILRDGLAGDPAHLARLQREAQLLASLNHPHIAAIYGLEESEGAHALVLELVEGETLAARIANGPLPIEEALSIARTDRRGTGRRARARDRASRSEARQRQIARRRCRQGARFRNREVGGTSRRSGPVGPHAHRRGSHRTRSDGGHSRLHGARTGEREIGGQALRHLGIRLCPVRDADRPASVRRQGGRRRPRRRADARSRLVATAAAVAALDPRVAATLPGARSTRAPR